MSVTDRAARYRVVHTAPTRSHRRKQPVPPATVDRIVDSLLELKATNGFLVNADYQRAGAPVGRCGRTVRRWYEQRLTTEGARTRDRHRHRYEIGELETTLIYAHGGNVAAAYEDLRTVNKAPVGLSAFRAAWNRVPATIRHGARIGHKALVKYGLYRCYTATKPLVVYQLDEHVCDTWVLPREHAKEAEAFRPRLVLLEDDCTRYVVAALVLRKAAEAADIAAAIAQSLRVREVEGVKIGGLPTRIHLDNATVNSAEVVAEAAVQLNIKLHYAAPYASWQKGKVERFFLTFERELGLMLPGSVHGTAQTREGHPLFRPPGTALLTFDQYCDAVESWIYHYNTARAHAGIAGMTPLARWAAAGVTPEQPREALLARSFLPADQALHKVNKLGVHFRNRYFSGAALLGQEGAKVKVRWVNDDPDLIFVFDEHDDYLGSLVPAPDVPDDEGVRLQARRDATEDLHNGLVGTARAIRQRAGTTWAGAALADATAAELAERDESGESAPPPPARRRRTIPGRDDVDGFDPNPDAVPAGASVSSGNHKENR